MRNDNNTYEWRIPMQSWAKEELKYVQLGDERLNKRLVKMVETFAGNPVFLKSAKHGQLPEPAIYSGTTIK